MCSVKTSKQELEPNGEADQHQEMGISLYSEPEKEEIRMFLAILFDVTENYQE